MHALMELAKRLRKNILNEVIAEVKRSEDTGDEGNPETRAMEDERDMIQRAWIKEQRLKASERGLSAWCHTS